MRIFRTDGRTRVNKKVPIPTKVGGPKIDQSFQAARFLMENYNKPLRRDVSSTSGGLLMYIKKGIAAKPVKMKITYDMFQFISITLHLKTSKWLLISLYRPEYVKIPAFFEQLDGIIVENSKLFSNIIIIMGRGVRIQDTNRTPGCLLYTSPSPRDRSLSRMPSSA